MGFSLAQPSTPAATEERPRRSRMPRVQRSGQKNRIGAPRRNGVLSTKYTDSETGLLYYGYRYYSPGLGRWISKDPMQESGGHNVYAYILNEPISNMDPLGLWSAPERNGNARAIVRATCGDKVAALAHVVDLNASEFALWLRSEDGQGLPGSADESITENRVFSVPNTAYIAVGRVAQWWGAIYWWLDPQARAAHAQWQGEGLMMLYDMWPPSGTVRSHLGDSDLYKFGYFGHAAAGILVLDTAGSYDVLGPAWYTRFRIADMVLIGCNTYQGEATWKENVSKEGLLTTVEGLLDFAPWTPAWHFRYAHGVE